MRTNISSRLANNRRLHDGTTHEGGPARRLTPIQELRRTILSCMLFEDTFYEDGVSISDRIKALVPQCTPIDVAELAIEAREKMHLRHAPLFLAREMARGSKAHRLFVADLLSTVIQRADELAEFLALYWAGDVQANNGAQTLSAQVKKGLAKAFRKFNAYALGKYNRESEVSLRDVLFLTHAKPKDAEQAALWKSVVDGTLESPDTWEVAISATQGEGKKAVWERLLQEGKLGGMALIRNLRNMEELKVEPELIRQALATAAADRVLPFRILTALRYAPRYAPELEGMMFRNLANLDKLPGETVILVDVSGSMMDPLSVRKMPNGVDKPSDAKRVDAACGLAVMAVEICERVRIVTFSDRVVAIPTYRGLGLVPAILGSQQHAGTRLGAAVQAVEENFQFNRLIVITDEQASDKVSMPNPQHKNYCINVGTDQKGIGYHPWVHIDGWSGAVLDYIQAIEREERR